MKSISAAIIVLAGTLLLCVSIRPDVAYSRETSFQLGFVVVIAGLVGWAVTVRIEK
jgi:hypothetical protein